MTLQITKIDGNSFGTDYSLGFPPGDEPVLPGVRAELVERVGAWPLLGTIRRDGRKLRLLVRIAGSDVDGLRTQLFRWFDPESETPVKLTGEEDSEERYLYVICEAIRPLGAQADPPRAYLITLAIHGDVRWRSETEESDNWNITASGQTHAVTNAGTDDAYPTFELTPTSTKSGGLAYKCFVPVVWPSNNPGWLYPVRLGPLDTATLVLASKMQADGDDLRVYVDGVEVDRWLVDMDTANTYVWLNMNFQPQQSGTLKTAIAGSGSISTIELNEDVSGFPNSGLVKIDDELFVYTGKSNAEKALTGVTRAAKGTSMAAHTQGDSVYWIQHEVVLAYGNASLGAPDVDDDYKPAFSLAAADSSNTQWKYTEFGDGSGKRAARWQRWGNVTLAGRGGAYTATQRALGDPYAVAGAWLGQFHGNAYGWFLNNPCGIVNAAWADGQKRAVTKEDFLVHLMYWLRDDDWWTWQATLADPSADNTWEAWSEPAAGADWDPANTLAIGAYFYAQDVEVGTITVSLNASETPVATIGSEQGNYTIEATLTNTTTGEAITITFELELNETLVVDTDEETVTYDADGSSQFQAVETAGGVRLHWLRLAPGSNTLQFDDTGTAALTLVTKFEKRHY